MEATAAGSEETIAGRPDDKHMTAAAGSERPAKAPKATDCQS